MGATGLAADPTEYRSRLGDQEDAQLDAWAAELLRDMVIRRGIVPVLDRFRASARLSEAEFEQVFSFGGGPPAVIGRDADGNQIVPATTLYALVPGLRARYPDARDRLVDYLVDNFHDFVFA